MCAVSAIGDNFRQTFPDKHPWYPTNPYLPNDLIWPATIPVTPDPAPPIDLSKIATKEDIATLRRDMEELKKLLKAAIDYDEKTEQRHCETEEKIALIKQIANAVGVDLSDLNLDGKNEQDPSE